MSDDPTPPSEAQDGETVGADAGATIDPPAADPPATDSTNGEAAQPGPRMDAANSRAAPATHPVPAPARSRGPLQALLRLLGAPLRLLPFERKRRRGPWDDVVVGPPPGGPAAQAAAARPAADPQPAPSMPDPVADGSETVPQAVEVDVDPGLIADHRVQLVLAALTGAIIAIGGGIGGGFLERVEDDALFDEAAAQADVEASEDHASAQANHGIPSAPGVGSDSAVEDSEDAQGTDAQATGADDALSGESAGEDPAATAAGTSPEYLRGYFDGQACALLDPETAECLSPADAVTRLNTAYLDGWAAALRSVGVEAPPTGAAATTSGGGTPRIVDLKRIEVEELNDD